MNDKSMYSFRSCLFWSTLWSMQPGQMNFTLALNELERIGIWRVHCIMHKFLNSCLCLYYWPIHTLHIFFYCTKPDKQKWKVYLQLPRPCLAQGKFLQTLSWILGNNLSRTSCVLSWQKDKIFHVLERGKETK